MKGNGGKPELPDAWRIYFWDVNWETLKKEADRWRPFIIARLADKGDVEQVKWLKAHFSIQEIASAVRSFRSVSAKTKNYWARYAETA